MKLAIQVEGHPASSMAAHSAYEFSKAALARNHRIIMVFFYYDGVFAGVLPWDGSSTEFPSAPRWSALAPEAPLDLVVCSAALERRGLLGRHLGTPEAGGTIQLAEGFRIGGLSQWVDACLRCDRYLTFAA